MEKSLPSENPYVIIPTYNEAGNIAKAIERILVAIPQVNVVVIDDSSPDGTADVVKAIRAVDPRVNLLVRASKSGLGSAYRFGFTHGIKNGATALIEMDADLSHEPEAAVFLLEKLDSGADLAIGSRYVSGGESPGLSPSRLALSKGGNLYAQISMGLKIRDATSGFRAYRPSLLERINLDTVGADGYGFQIEMVFRATLLGAVIAEYPIIFRQRTEGVSKMSNSIVKEAISLCTIWGIQRRLRQLIGNRKDFIPYHKNAGSIVGAIASSMSKG